MEIKIYFAVKVLCAIFILYRLWIFIFSQQVYDAWEKVYHMMRYDAYSPYQVMEIS